MDSHIVLDKNTEYEQIHKNTWYLLRAGGKVPSARVGHTCLAVTENSHSVIYCIGGANPSGSFAEIYILDLNKWKWQLFPAVDFTGRYEHAAFASEDKIYVFGGANMLGNMEDIQALNTSKNVWFPVTTAEVVEARTHHTSPVITGDKLVIFSGGHSGADPVEDKKVHVFNPHNNSWTTPIIKGETPESRQGHVMVALGNKVYLHGGMSGEAFFDDFHLLDFDSQSWRRLNGKSDQQPSARAAHGAIMHDKNLVLFGGMNATGALSDMHTYDTDFDQWTEILFGNRPPAPRLDFAMCLVHFSVQQSTAKAEDESTDDSGTLESGLSSMSISQQSDEVKSNPGTKNLIENEDQKFILIHGGMNTEGDIYDDCFVFKL